MKLKSILDMNKKGNMEERGKQAFIAVIFLVLIVGVVFASGSSLFPNWSSIADMPLILVITIPLIILLVLLLILLSFVKTSGRK